MLQKLQNLAAFSSACQALRAGKSPLLLDGLAAVHKAHFAAALCRELGRGAVLLTDEEAAATRLMEDINRFYGEERALLYPEREFTYHSVESVSREYEQLRLGVLRRLQRDPSLIVVGTVTAALQPTLLPEQLSAATLSLRVGQEYPPQKLLEFLVQAGYQRAEQVEGIGQFATRGGIVDFYPPQYSWPIRLEYWGDEVDSIAAFSLESQRREDSMKLLEITPVRELLYRRPLCRAAVPGGQQSALLPGGAAAAAFRRGEPEGEPEPHLLAAKAGCDRPAGGGNSGPGLRFSVPGGGGAGGGAARPPHRHSG